MEDLGAWRGDHSSCSVTDELCRAGQEILLAIVTLPLNFIPVVGTVSEPSRPSLRKLCDADRWGWGVFE